MSLSRAHPSDRHLSSLTPLWERLAQTRPDVRSPARPGSPGTLLPAAVLVGIIDAAPEPAVLLTVRAQGLRRHAGQIAFPGGRMDAGDRDMVDTALREAREETGLAPGTVQVVGFLPEQAIISGYRVTPVVARLESLPPLTPDPVEVAECFLLPWRHVMDDRHHVPAERPASHGTSRPYDILYGERRIWGATARILQSLREQALAPTPRSAGT